MLLGSGRAAGARGERPAFCQAMWLPPLLVSRQASPGRGTGLPTASSLMLMGIESPLRYWLHSLFPPSWQWRLLDLSALFLDSARSGLCLSKQGFRRGPQLVSPEAGWA